MGLSVASAVGGATLALVASAVTVAIQHELDAERGKLETVGSAYEVYLREIGNAEVLAESAGGSDNVDLSPSKQALDGIRVYGSGDAAHAAFRTFNALRDAVETNDSDSEAWAKFRTEKQRYIDELRDDLGVGEMEFDTE